MFLSWNGTSHRCIGTVSILLPLLKCHPFSVHIRFPVNRRVHAKHTSVGGQSAVLVIDEVFRVLAKGGVGVRSCLDNAVLDQES